MNAAVDRLPSGVVAFLLTDIEGSTALWDTESTEMPGALMRHDELVDEVVSVSGGFVLKHKGEGDSTLSVFQRASEAATAATALQSALRSEAWTTNAPLRVRMAIHLGEAHERDGDYFGPTLNRAARLRSLAAGGQVVVSSAAAAVIRDQLPPGAALEELGEHTLRGMSGTERVYELFLRTEGRAAARRPSAVPEVPVQLRSNRDVFGREAEMAQLDELWARARAEGPVGVLLGGEPGVGKTTLAGEFARRVVATGGAVVFGRCDEEIALPYQPFAEALAQLLRARPDLLAAPAVSAVVADLSNLVPDLVPPRLDRAASAVDAGIERHRMFHAAGVVLREAAVARPLMLVVDDAQWADTPSVSMLRKLLQPEENAPILFCVTYRTTDVEPDDAFAGVIADASRKLRTQRIAVGGLDVAAVESVVRATVDPDVDADSVRVAAARLRDRTNGNAFFVHELVEHGLDFAAGSLAADEVPESILEVVDRRLLRLHAEHRAVLTTAAVLGLTFSVAVLDSVAVENEEVILDAVDAAVAGEFLVEMERDQFRFAHDLTRDALLARLSSARGARLHRRVADVFTEWPDARGNAAVIAHHFAEAGAAAEAAHWAIFAADDALRQLAHDNALAIASRALALVDAEATPDLKARAELLLLIGRAQSDNVQLTQRAEIVWSAVDDARRVGATELIARAAIVLDEWTSDTNELDDRWVALAEECVEVLGVDAPALRSELLARLAWGIVASGRDPDRGAPLADAAVELARSTGDVTPQVIGACVHAVSCFGTGDAARRLDLTLHAQRIYNGPPSNTSWLVRRLLIPIRLELGDRAGFREEVEAFRTELRGLRLLPASAFLTSYDVLDAFLDGRLDAAAAGVDEVGKAAAETGWPPLVAIWTGQLYWLHRERGTAADLAPVLAAAVEENPTIIGFRGALALTLAEAGALDAAASHIERLHDLEARDLVGDATASVALSQLAEAAVRVGDRKAAARFYDLLLPHRGHLLVVGWGVICSGAADRYLGMLASLLGGTAAAVDHYEAALELEQRVDAPALVARTRYALGALRRDRNVLAEVAETAVSLGMTGLAREATDAAL